MGYWKLPGQYNKLTRDNIARYNAKVGGKAIESVLLNPAAYKADLMNRFRKKGGRIPDYFYSYSDLNSNLLWKKIAGILEEYADQSGFYKDEISNEEYRKSILTPDGKLFALPYYGAHSAFIYNEAHIRKAGFDNPPRDWNELETQALRIKEKGITDVPILVPIHGDGSVETLYALILGMSPKTKSYLFDEDYRTKFEEGSPLFNLLEWLIDGTYRKRIVSRESVAHDVLPGAEQMKKGRFTFIWLPWYLLSYINYPNGRKKSPIKAGLNPGSGYTTCYTRTYTVSLSALKDKTKLPDLLRVLEYFGGKTDENFEPDHDHGEYRITKRLGIELGVPSPIKSLWEDKEYCSALDQWGDIEIYKKQDEKVFNSLNDPYSPPWLAEWDGEWQSAPLRNTVHKVLLRNTGKRDLSSNLGRLSRSWNELRKKYTK